MRISFIGYNAATDEYAYEVFCTDQDKTAARGRLGDLLRKNVEQALMLKLDLPNQMPKGAFYDKDAGSFPVVLDRAGGRFEGDLGSRVVLSLAPTRRR